MLGSDSLYLTFVLQLLLQAVSVTLTSSLQVLHLTYFGLPLSNLLGMWAGIRHFKPFLQVRIVLESISKGLLEVVKLHLIGPWCHCRGTIEGCLCHFDDMQRIFRLLQFPQHLKLLCACLFRQDISGIRKIFMHRDRLTGVLCFRSLHTLHHLRHVCQRLLQSLSLCLPLLLQFFNLRCMSIAERLSLCRELQLHGFRLLHVTCLQQFYTLPHLIFGLLHVHEHLKLSCACLFRQEMLK